jgi:hypothetical protein
MNSLHVALAVAVVVVIFLTFSTIVLVRLRKRRLVAQALHFHVRTPELSTLPILPFIPSSAAVQLAPLERARVSGLTLAEAEDVLDWLEQNGYEQRELLGESGTSFAVEFRFDRRPHVAPDFQAPPADVPPPPAPRSSAG